MAKNQKKYTQEFKQQLVDSFNTGNYSFPRLSSEYGVAKSTILSWVRSLSPIQVAETETITMKEYKALQKKMKELEIENEILKKATANYVFSKWTSLFEYSIISSEEKTNLAEELSAAELRIFYISLVCLWRTK